MKIFYFDRTGGACDYYRAVLPLSTLAREYKGKHKVSTMTRADLLVAIETDNHTKVMDLLEADIIVIPRLAETRFFHRMKEMNRHAKIVLEYDDNLFNVSPLSPHYADHGADEVRMSFPDGKSLDVWVDKVNIDIARNRRSLDEIREVLGLADMVTVTTDILADVYRPMAKKVVPLPNCLDLNIWRKLAFRPRADVRMGWFGGSSHYEDWTLLSDVLPGILVKHENLKLVIMGQKFEGTIKRLPKDRVEFHPWIDTAAYPYKAAILDLDFAVIPLRDTVFNRSKSNIKWVEMGALEVPCVASYVSPYKEFATEENGVWIDGNGTEDWKQGISLLAQSPKYRSRIGGEAYNTVSAHFNMTGQVHKWIEAYEGVLNGVPNTADLVGNRNGIA